MSAFLDLLAAALPWYLGASFTAGALLALLGYIRNTIRERAR